jgi:hypothetical protein
MQKAADYAAACMMHLRPFNVDGDKVTKRKEGKQEEFWRWAELLKAFAVPLAQYQSPKLASMTVKDERDDEGEGEYQTVWELRARMIKKGLPVDHLVIEHKPSALEDDAGPAEAGAYTKD